MSYSWYIFGRALPTFESRCATTRFRARAWPGPEDARDWEDLTSQLDFRPAYWAEVPLAQGGVPFEIWNAYEVLARQIADAMHGVALTEDGGILHLATRVQPMAQVAFDEWLSKMMASAARVAELRRAVKNSASHMHA